MKYIKSIIKVLITMMIGLLLITIFHYFDIFNGKIINILKIIVVLLSLFIGGFSLAKQSYKKGWYSGIKIGSIIIILLTLFNLLFWKNDFSWNILLYYLILLVSSVTGGVIGINFSEKKEDAI